MGYQQINVNATEKNTYKITATPYFGDGTSTIMDRADLLLLMQQIIHATKITADDLRGIADCMDNPELPQFRGAVTAIYYRNRS